MINKRIKAHLDVKPLFRDHPSEFGKGVFDELNVDVIFAVFFFSIKVNDELTDGLSSLSRDF